jgi:hypothetical protein
MKSIRVPIFACVIVFGLVLAHPAAATNWLDLSVAFKTLPLLTNKITGDATVAVIYDPMYTATKSDAEAIKKIIDDGLEAPGGVKLTAQLMSTTELSKLGGFKIAFLAHGVPAADYNGIYAAADASGALTMSADLDCVRANKCVLGIVSKPSVIIYYSSAAAAAANISFAPAFTMLVNQI